MNEAQTIPQTPPPPAPAAAEPLREVQPSVAPAAVVAGPDPRQKSPILAMILSCMPGLGQVYVGYYQRGFVHAVVVAVMLTIVTTGALGGLEPLVVLPMSFFWLYNIIDAGRKAQLYNQALAGGAPVELPDDIKMPALGGSIFGGSLIFIAGSLLLLHTKFDVSMEWMAEWWPVAVIAFGAYLIYRGAQDRSGRDSEPYDA